MNFVSERERLKPARELDFPATQGFGAYKGLFPKEAVAPPAKMSTDLLEYLIEHYTKPGETVPVTKEILATLDETEDWCECE